LLVGHSHANSVGTALHREPDAEDCRDDARARILIARDPPRDACRTSLMMSRQRATSA